MGVNIGGTGEASAGIGVIRNGVHKGLAAEEQPQPPADVRLAIQLQSPVEGRFREFIDANRKTPDLTCVQQGSYAGQSLALCGAGPSLATADIRGVDQIFACNSALQYLMAKGVNVSGAIGIDQTPGLLREWQTTFDVPYFVASTCDPELIAHLVAHGRKPIFFHNHVGLEDELTIYTTWPDSYLVGQGFTVVSRFIGVAQWLGFERIDIYGADCAFTDTDIAHANGERAHEAYVNPLIMRGKLPPSPREWHTRPDMLRDAVDLARRVRDSKGTIRLMGDTLPVALLGKDDVYLDLVSRTLAPGEAPPNTP